MPRIEFQNSSTGEVATIELQQIWGSIQSSRTARLGEEMEGRRKQGEEGRKEERMERGRHGRKESESCGVEIMTQGNNSQQHKPLETVLCGGGGGHGRLWTGGPEGPCCRSLCCSASEAGQYDSGYGSVSVRYSASINQNCKKNKICPCSHTCCTQLSMNLWNYKPKVYLT